MNDITASLVRQKCAPCEGGVPPLESANVQALLKGLQGWTQEGSVITKTYTFRNYFETMAFVNATAWISHAEDHHPDMSVHYNRCVVAYSTHDAGGISAKDFAPARPNGVVTSWKSHVCMLGNRNIRCAGEAEAGFVTAAIAVRATAAAVARRSGAVPGESHVMPIGVLPLVNCFAALRFQQPMNGDDQPDRATVGDFGSSFVHPG